MKNKYPGEMIDPRILEEQAKQSQLLDKPKDSSFSFDLSKVTATPGATAESQGWDEDPLDHNKLESEPEVVEPYKFTVACENGKTWSGTLHLNNNIKDVIDDGIPDEHINECSGILHPSGKTNYAMQIFTEALVKNIEQAENIYTAQAINAYTRERGPFDFSLESELANIVSVEDILEFKPCPPFVPEVINGNNRHYIGKGMTHDDFFKKDHNHPLLTEEHLHMHHSSFAGDGFIPPEDFNVNPGTPYTQHPLNDDELQKLREVVEGDNDGNRGKVAILGTPRLQAEYIIAACKDAGIEVTQHSTYDESDLIGDIDMKMLSTAALGMKHLSANPYSDGRKPRVESEIDSNRKLDRTRQKNLNKKQGYGKRLTKKDKLTIEQKHNYIEVDPSTGKTKVINNE